MKPHWVLRYGMAFLLALALGGCADYLDRRAAVGDGKHPDLARLGALTMAPYREWLAETPPDCNSAALHGARGSVLMTASLIDPARNGFEAAYQGGQWILEVADGARDHGCALVARLLYDKVTSSYVGIGFAGLRARAVAGLADLKAEHPRLAIHAP